MVPFALVFTSPLTSPVTSGTGPGGLVNTSLVYITQEAASGVYHVPDGHFREHPVSRDG